MDPIEKLLGDLAPGRAPGDLDQTMTRLFDRADRKARLRRAGRSLTVMTAMLVIGLGAGYRWGASSTPQRPMEFRYVLPAADASSAGFLDYSSPGDELLDGDIQFSIEVHRAAAAPADPETEKGV